ncbi:hypothetical protein PsorP6_013672 [Peronosclerospora sorghi]|uniref:Uncharacterized protein n=1 Tax=Peronosclerospora sorghi TaxID=230839 RepID=A0ACC0VHZ5_9STRA|nr:hypothetical protein PsorP6_013672 [Peronosclerospora sorghi]
MASDAELRAENERMVREINALRSANEKLEREVVELSLEWDELHHTGSKIVQTLEQELDMVVKELTSLRSECQSMINFIKNADAEKNKIEEHAPKPASRKLPSFVDHTMQLARGKSVHRQRRSPTVEKVGHGITKAASFMIPPTGKENSDGRRALKDSSPTLSYSKIASKSFRFSTYSHYGSFLRRGGPKQMNRDPVMVL